jgi:hypothetical protein
LTRTERRPPHAAPLAVALAFAACGATACRNKCPEGASPPVASAAVRTAAPAAAPLQVEARCRVTPEEVSIHVPIVVSYTGTAARGSSRTLWSLTCNRKTKRCDGAHLSLDHVERGDGIVNGDLEPSPDATLTSSIGAQHVIRLSSRTFTVDTATGKVGYVESAPGLEGHGESACQGL